MFFLNFYSDILLVSVLSRSLAMISSCPFFGGAVGEIPLSFILIKFLSFMGFISLLSFLYPSVIPYLKGVIHGPGSGTLENVSAVYCVHSALYFGCSFPLVSPLQISSFFMVESVWIFNYVCFDSFVKISLGIKKKKQKKCLIQKKKKRERENRKSSNNNKKSKR